MPKNYEDLTITDNFMFCKVMSDVELCREVIETLLSIKIERLEQVHSEHTLNPDVLSKGVRCDVYVKDSDNVYDIELQMCKKSNLALRSRYYQSVFDVDTLEMGESYEKLKMSYIIFLCPFDYFGGEHPVLTFENMARENSLIKLNDKVLKIFYNFIK
mgnify:CR=1 FL=1